MRIGNNIIICRIKPSSNMIRNESRLVLDLGHNPRPTTFLILFRRKMSRFLEYDCNRSWWYRNDLAEDSSIKLTDMALLAVIKLAEPRNKEIKAVRNDEASKKYFAGALPLELRRKLLKKAAMNGEKPTTFINLLSLLESEDGLVDDKVDLMGNQRNCIDMQFEEQNVSPNWRWLPFHIFTPMDGPLLQCLDRILKNAESKRSLKEICFSADRHDLSYLCDIPARLTKGQTLVKVVIFNGATNHILRILGLHCPMLRFLDFSHSVSVTETGVRNLLLQRPSRKIPSLHNFSAITGARFLSPHRDIDGPVEHLPKNPCVSTLEIIILTGTSMTENGCNFTCMCIPGMYLHRMRPEVKICKMKMERANVNIGIQTMTLAAVIALKERDPLYEYNYFEPPRQSQDKPITIVYCRKPTEFTLRIAIKLEGDMITGLHCPCFNSDEYLTKPKVNLEALANNFPNLKTFEGAVEGILIPRPIHRNLRFPQLEKANVWALGSTQAVYFLRHSPVLKRFKYSKIHIWNDPDPAEIDEEANQVLQLTHDVLTDAMSNNSGLLQTLEEFIVLPMLTLNKDSLSWITERCVNLKAIGDFHGWSVTKDEIQEVASNLRNEGKTGLTFVIHNLPNLDRDSEERDSWIPF